ncbi:MAG: hypothetical protein Q8P57_00945 [Candidatus Pacearchaeota archaeon]|nr:hypothetical protein [Candidatus Pacearchaeota archaeon]
MEDLPLEVKLKIALESSTSGKPGTIIEITKSYWTDNRRTGLDVMFASGADEVVLPCDENPIYRKYFDRSYLDNSLPVRELRYKRE